MPENLEKKFCVIGHPIGHSLSPAIHNTVFRHFGLDFSYSAEDVPPEALEKFTEEARSGRRPGFNVTIPHKQTVIPLLDGLDSLSERIGAVNTVVNKSGRMIGHNTDVSGFAFSLINAGWVPENPVFLLGAGGAARAALEGLASMEVKTVFATDTQADRLHEFKRHFKSVHENMEIIVDTSNSLLFNKFLNEAKLFINATPVGMWPKIGESPLDPSLLPGDCMVYDMVPKPVTTSLLGRARTLGMKTIPGIRMLVAQALKSDSLYLNRDIPDILFEQVERELLEELEHHGLA